MQQKTIESGNSGQRLDKFLHKYLPEASTSFLYKMLRKKNITLNGKKAAGNEILQDGDCISFFFSEETYAKFRGETEAHKASVEASLNEFEKAYAELSGIEVLYEDAHILILNKPAGILTQKASSQDISLNEWMIGYLLQGDIKSEIQNGFRPSVCNRLDRNTSGIVLCGKSLQGLQFLSGCIKDRSVKKYYCTICQGILRNPQTLEGYLTKDKKTNKVTISKKSTGDATENYICTKYMPLNTSEQFTLLQVELVTGKTHQIRAHLSSIGHPILGDAKYGKAKINQPFAKEFGLHHQLLHAEKIIFPVTEDVAGVAVSGKTFVAPKPPIFKKIETALHFNTLSGTPMR